MTVPQLFRSRATAFAVQWRGPEDDDAVAAFCGGAFRVYGPAGGPPVRCVREAEDCDTELRPGDWVTRTSDLTGTAGAAPTAIVVWSDDRFRNAYEPAAQARMGFWRRAWMLALARLRLDRRAVCIMSQGRGLIDFHDYPDTASGEPFHMATDVCKRCGKEFRM